MSGLYISGIELPKECEYLDLVIMQDGEVYWYDHEGVSVAKAVPVLDHGDLIDRDELMKHEVYMPREGGNLPIVYMSYVKAAKTVIPAERGWTDETD